MTTQYPLGLLYSEDPSDPFKVSRADKLQAAARGLLAAGPQLMAAGAPTLTPGGGAQGLANFGLAFNRGYQSYIDNARDTALGAYQIDRQKQSDARRDKMLALEEEKAEQEKALAARKQSAIDAVLAGDDNPVNRAWALADPAGFLKNKVTPKDPWAGTKVVGGNVVRPGDDGSVETIYSVPQKPEKETWGNPVPSVVDGEPVLLQFSNLGNSRPVQGHAPYEKPVTPKVPNSVQEYNYAKEHGFKGTYADWKSSNKPETNITFNDKGFDELSKLDAQAISDVGEGVRTLRTILPDLDRMVSASEKFGTGAMANTKLWAGQFARALDIEGVDNLEQGELIRAIQSRLAPQMRATGSGASSDRDVEMFLNSLPNMMQTPGGNKLIAGNFRRILERKQAEERIMRQHYRETGGTLDGVYQRIDEELGPSIFNDEDRALMVGAGPNGLPQYQATPQGQPQPRLRYNPETNELDPVGPTPGAGERF